MVRLSDDANGAWTTGAARTGPEDAALVSWSSFGRRMLGASRSWTGRAGAARKTCAPTGEETSLRREGVTSGRPTTAEAQGKRCECELAVFHDVPLGH